MDRSTAIAKLKANENEIRALGATALYLFGSTARDEAKRRSDVDVFIDYDRSKKFSLLDLVGLQQFLQDKLKAKVDLTTRSSLDPLLKRRIESSAVRVF